MKVVYTEFIVFKSGETMLLQKVLNVTKYRITCVYVENNENDGFWLAKKRINSGPEEAVINVTATYLQPFDLRISESASIRARNRKGCRTPP